MLRIRPGSTQWLRAYAYAGSIAFACYLLYAWYFYPLTNPYLFILFAKSQPPWKGGVPFYMNISVAGGLLWTVFRKYYSYLPLDYCTYGFSMGRRRATSFDPLFLAEFEA